jgi:hypothetical protein
VKINSLAIEYADKREVIIRDLLGSIKVTGKGAFLDGQLPIGQIMAEIRKAFREGANHNDKA